MTGSPICPICKTEIKAASPPVNNPYRPFCSRRCQLIDLGNWLGERYTVPGETVTQEDGTASSAEPDDAKR